MAVRKKTSSGGQGMAACTAPVLGHNTLRAVMNCPQCSNDPRIQQHWRRMGVDITVPPQISVRPAFSDAPVWAGKSPKAGHVNYHVDASFSDLVAVLSDRQQAHRPTMFEGCKFYVSGDFFRYMRMARQALLEREPGDAPVEFVDCTFYGPLDPDSEMAFKGPMRFTKCSMRAAMLVFADGAQVTGSELTADVYLVSDGAVVEKSAFRVGDSITVERLTGGRLIEPTWFTKRSEPMSKLPIIRTFRPLYYRDSTATDDITSVASSDPTVVLGDVKDWIVIGDAEHVAGVGADTLIYPTKQSMPRRIKMEYLLTNRQVSPDQRIPIDMVGAWMAYEDLCGGQIPDRVNKGALAIARALTR